ncbi:MAG: hypothetical protein J6C46_00975 [Clostridia bacterium]|nr:hypothetical protein [Clostridia bacterium]
MAYSGTSNRLKEDNIRVFGFRDKYLLVDQKGIAFMMFEKVPQDNSVSHTLHVPTIRKVEFELKNKLEKIFPMATQVQFKNISKTNLNYMCDQYLESIMFRSKSEEYAVRVNEIVLRYHVSIKVAKILAKTPEGTNYRTIIDEINEVRFFLQFNQKYRQPLIDGERKARIKILKSLFSEKTCKLINIDFLGWMLVKDLIDVLLAT